MAKQRKPKDRADSENPKCFISYSWESDAHRDWVRRLAAELQQRGVVTFLDQWQVHPGMDIVRYMESSIRDSDHVLLVCTPTFAKKANAAKGGVGYERIIVTGEIFQGIGSDKKFVPVLRSGSPSESLPSYLMSKVYLDFRDDKAFDKELENLLRHIHSQPRYIPPPLGPKPLLPPVDSLGSRAVAKASKRISSKTSLPAKAAKKTSPQSNKSRALVKMKAGYSDNVFINCPFDNKHRALFDVLIFTVADCGFRPRTVREYSNAGETQIQKVFTLISECRFGIHDISQTELDKTTKLPKFNIPLELGLFLGAQRFDPIAKRQRNCLVLDKERYRYQKYISDLSGLDIQSHNGDPHTASSIVRDWLRVVSARSSIPSGEAIWNHFKDFKKNVPSLSKRLGIEVNKLPYPDLAYLIAEWLRVRYV